MNLRNLPLRLLLLPLSLSAATAAAGDDFGIWTGISAEKKINRKFSAEAGIDFRAEQQLKSAARWNASIGIGYKPLKWLRMGAGYSYIYDRSPQESKVNYNKTGTRRNGYNVDHGFWRSKHRLYFNITGKIDAGWFTFSLRERYMYTHHMKADCIRDRYRDPLQGGYNGPTYTWNGEQFMNFEQVDNPRKAKNVHYLRSRLQMSYNIRHCPLEPFVSYEFSNDLGNALHLDKTRLMAGSDWKINKKHTLSVAYVYQNGADDDASNDIHVIDIGYKFKF